MVVSGTQCVRDGRRRNGKRCHAALMRVVGCDDSPKPIGLRPRSHDLRRRRQGDAEVRAYLARNWRVTLEGDTGGWHFRDLSAWSQVRSLGFDPATASQVRRNVPACPTDPNTAFR